MTSAAVARADAAASSAPAHALLRFSVGITVGFMLAEVLGWAPTFLVPVLTAVLLAILPFSPPLKVGVGLAAVMTLSATFAFMLSSLLRGSPIVLVGCIGLVVFLAFLAMARGKSALPPTLLLLCMSTVPVIAMAAPAHAELLPIALARAMAVAVLIVWVMHAIWPQVAPPAPKPPAVAAMSPVRTALLGTAIVMPLMLAYLMLAMTDALPVLVTTVLLVATFDARMGAMQGTGMVLGNLFGGFVGLLAFLLLAIAPSLPVLALLTFLIAAIAAAGMARGGAMAGIVLLTCNSAFIIFSIALASPDSSMGVWFSRLLQFVLAWLFAVALMNLAWPRSSSGRPEKTNS